jgi:surface antigen Omp85-like protein
MPTKGLVVLSLSVALILMSGAASFAQETAPASPPQAADVAPAAPGFIPEPQILTALMNASDRSLLTGRERDDGLYVELGNMITGAGWISAGPGYRRHVLHDRAVADVSAALSWNLYKVVQGRLDVPRLLHDRLSVGAQAMYQDLMEVDYFGRGQDTLRSDRTAYRFNNIDVVGYATIRLKTWLSIDGRFGRISRASLAMPPEDPASGLPVPAYAHGDVTIAADWRDNTGHPIRGGRYRATAAGYFDRDTGANSIQRFEIEGSQFVPLTANWLLALHGWEVFTVPSSSDQVPFYLMPSLGGDNTLRGYDDYRFHDNHMQSFSVESRWALLAHVDAAAFVDAGKVASRAASLDFTHLKTSYGVGFRVHNSAWTLGRMDIGHSAEGWRVFFQVSDPFTRSAPASGRPSVVPFVP